MASMRVTETVEVSGVAAGAGAADVVGAPAGVGAAREVVERREMARREADVRKCMVGCGLWECSLAVRGCL